MASLFSTILALFLQYFLFLLKLKVTKDKDSPYYCNTGCRVFKGGIQNFKDFWLKTTKPKATDGGKRHH